LRDKVFDKVTYSAVNFLFFVVFVFGLCPEDIVMKVKMFGSYLPYEVSYEKKPEILSISKERLRDLCVRWSFGRCFMERTKGF